MKNQEKVFKEARKVTKELIRYGLAEEYNFPMMQKAEKDNKRYAESMAFVAISIQFHNPCVVLVTVLNHFVYSSDSHFSENP